LTEAKSGRKYRIRLQAVLSNNAFPEALASKPKRGAKTPNCDAHLVDAFRLTRQRGLFVAGNRQQLRRNEDA